MYVPLLCICGSWAQACCAFSAGVCLDGLLRWWDMGRGECVRVIAGHQGRVNVLRKSPDGMRLASCAADGAIMIWDVGTGRLLRTLRHDRPYERMSITDLGGITEAQRITLPALG
jgi:WD40 repeat protein